jgi:uncharacterized protein YjiS (DUF1127 family)
MSHRLTNDLFPVRAGERWQSPGGIIWLSRWRACWQAVRVAVRRQRSRHAISQLDARTLKDIGITLAEAETEANKPLWRD